MTDDLTRIERQLVAVARRLDGVNQLALLTVIQCACYQVRGMGSDPHALIAPGPLARPEGAV